MSASENAQGQSLLTSEDTPVFNDNGLDSVGRFVHAGLQADSDDENDGMPWRDQGDRLPDPAIIRTVVLTPIPKLKVDGSNFLRWRRDVNQALSTIQIQQVLEYDLVRPDQGTVNRSKWKRWSSFAAHWMTVMMNEDTRCEIEWGLADTEWARNADDLLCDVLQWFRAIYSPCRGIVKMERSGTMRRRDFKSTSEYLSHIQRHINMLYVYGIRPRWRQLLYRILEDLGRGDEVVEEIYE